MYKLLITVFFASSVSILYPKNRIEKATDPVQTSKASPFVGNWEWIHSSDELSFDINIKQVNNKLIGQYCGTAYTGRKTDCTSDNEISFEVSVPTKNIFICSFRSGFSGNKGTVQISIKGRYLIWKIIKEPKGEFYCPDVAKLVK